MWVNDVQPVRSDDWANIREILIVWAMDPEVAAAALDDLLPLLGIPVDAVGLVGHDDATPVRAQPLTWDLACKGITVYCAGSREKEVLTAGTRDQDSADQERHSHQEDAQPLTTPGGLIPRRRPTRVQGITERLQTGHGNIYVTIDFDDNGRPFEVFTALGKAGSSDSAQLEAVARLVSMSLRAGVDPEEVVAQFRGITDEPVWDHGVLIRSAPDAIAHVLARAIGLERGSDVEGQLGLFHGQSPATGVAELTPGGRAAAKANGNGNGRSGWGSCPECSGPLVFQEGCLMCRECGYNKCG